MHNKSIIKSLYNPLCQVYTTLNLTLVENFLKNSCNAGKNSNSTLIVSQFFIHL